MWTTDDRRCSQGLRLSRSGWGQPVASSPDRAAPHGGRSLSPARQQLVPIVVPRTRPSDGGPPPVGTRPAMSLPPEREPKQDSRRRRPLLSLPAERRAEAGLRRRRPLPSAPPPPELGTHAGPLGRYPLTLFNPRPSSRLPLASRWHSAGALHSFSHFALRSLAPWAGHGRRTRRHSPWSSWSGARWNPWPTVMAQGRLTR